MLPSPAGAPVTPSRTARRRWDLIVAWLVVLGPVFALALWGAGRQQVADLEERMVRDANATLSVARARPIHRAPEVAGSEAERVARRLPAIHDAVEGLGPGALERVKAICAGEAPLSQLPADAVTVLDRAREPLGELLAASRTAQAELPPGMAEGEGAVPLTAFLDAARLAALQAKLSLREGRVREAAAWCADGLALARDVAQAARGYLGSTVASSMATALTPVCADALAASSRIDRAALVAELRAIRDGFPTVVEMLQAEGLEMDLLIAGSFDDGRLARRLTAATRRRLAQGREKESSAFDRFYSRDGWRATRATADALVRAAAIEDELDRDQAFDRVGRETRRAVNVLTAIATANPIRYVRGADATVRRLDALALVAGALEHLRRHRAWPERVAELAAEGLLTPPEIRRLGGAELDGDEEGLLVRLDLPGMDPQPAQLELFVGAR